jgi:predicted AAA+ superfamily ATPase
VNRIYEKLLTDHFASTRQMAFLSGPRQSGKTTLAKFGIGVRLLMKEQEKRILSLHIL